MFWLVIIDDHIKIHVSLVICGRYVPSFWISNLEFHLYLNSKKFTFEQSTPLITWRIDPCQDFRVLVEGDTQLSKVFFDGTGVIAREAFSQG
jgi:hypothetical protein